MTLAMVSLAGIPPLAGFFGKFLLIKAALEQGQTLSAFYWLVAIALAGVVISLWYYFGVIRAIYWSNAPAHSAPVRVTGPIKWALYACLAGIIYLGVYPNSLIRFSNKAIASMQVSPVASVQAANLGTPAKP